MLNMNIEVRAMQESERRVLAYQFLTNSRVTITSLTTPKLADLHSGTPFNKVSLFKLQLAPGFLCSVLWSWWILYPYISNCSLPEKGQLHLRSERSWVQILESCCVWFFIFHRHFQSGWGVLMLQSSVNRAVHHVHNPHGRVIEGLKFCV